MLSLALIPLVTLLVLTFMAITTKNRYSVATDQIQSKLEQQRESILSGDQENDRKLTLGLAEATEPLGKLFSEYGTDRGGLLPGVNVDPPHAWTFEHLTDYLKRQYQVAQSRQARRELFRAAVFTLVVLSVAGGLALTWYHFHSTPTTVEPLPDQATVPTVVDPFDDFNNSTNVAP